MSEKFPFLDEEGWWKDVDKSYQSNMVSLEKFSYIGEGLFLYNGSIIYNPENGVCFEHLTNRDYSTLTNKAEFVGFESYHEEGTANHNIFFKYFNTQTGECREIKGFFEKVQRPKELYDICEGLFFAKGETWTRKNFQYTEYVGFFDLDGNMILDLSDYAIVDYHGYGYKNGQYTITCANSSGICFDITFDKQGNITNQEKSLTDNQNGIYYVPKITIPKAIGRMGTEVAAELRESGLEVKILDKYTEDYKNGIVYAIYPEEGSSCEKGELVTIYVANNPTHQ